jgi:hypothetical protein
MMKMSQFLILFVLLGITCFAADVAINGKLTTIAATTSNTIDKNDDASDGVGFLYVYGDLNTSVSLSDNVKVVLEIELNDKVSNGASMKNGFKYTGGNGGPNPATVEVDEMYMLIEEFFADALSLKIGSQRLEYSLRNNKRSMVLNSDFTAFKGKYKFEGGFLDLFYGKKFESLQSVNTSSDADVYGLHLEWNFGENIHTIFYANNATFDNAGDDHGNIISVGAGVDLFLLEKKLELYLEVAGQFGALSETVDQNGFGADAGVRWNFIDIGSIKKLWFELNVGYRSGNDGKVDSSVFWNKWASSAGTLLAEGRYASESPLYLGYADDTYLAIRLETGADWTEKLNTGLTVAMYDNTDKNSDPYGIEIDVTAKYKQTENLSFICSFGVFLPDDGLAADGDTIFAIACETVVLF